MPPLPNRGEIWLADLNPTRGHEQAGARPVLIISTDPFNHGPAGLVFVLPLTRTDRRIPIHVLIDPPEGRVSVRKIGWGQEPGAGSHPLPCEKSKTLSAF